MSNITKTRFNLLGRISLRQLFYLTMVAAVACWWIQLHLAANWPLYPGDFAVVGILLCISSAVDIEQPELSIQLFLLGMAFLLIQSASDNVLAFETVPTSNYWQHPTEIRPTVQFALLRPLCVGVIVGPILYRRWMSLDRRGFACAAIFLASGYLSVAISGWWFAKVMTQRYGLD